jgi:hypothetical protein
VGKTISPPQYRTKMKKYLVVLAAYDDWRQDFYEQYTKINNKKYCLKHNFEYIEFNKENVGDIFRNSFVWNKFYNIQKMVNDSFFKFGDIITQLDADMAIFDHSVSLETSKSFAYAIDSCNTHCMGMSTIHLNNWSYKLIQNILSEDRYKKLNDKITTGSMGEQSSFWHIFTEQASWYSLAGIQRHSWIPFPLMKHWGWHSEVNEDTIYTLQELYQHVEIFPTIWNVTHLPPEDGEDKFYMIPTRSEDTIIRHFAGGRQWRKEYFI